MQTSNKSRKRSTRGLCVLLMGCVISWHAQATPPPVPKKKDDALKKYEIQLQEEQDRINKLQDQANSQNKELSDTKKTLVEVADEMRENENKMRNLEAQIDDLTDQENIIKANLQNDRASISRLILALERIRRVPPEAMLANPETPFKTAQSAMLMSDIVANLQIEAENLKQRLDKLNKVSTKLSARLADLNETDKQLKEQHNKIASLMQQRENLYKKTNKDIKAQEFQIERLSLKAKSLGELVTTLKEKNGKIEEVIAAVPSASTPQANQILETSAFQPSTDIFKSSRLPISGIIRIRYGEKDLVGARSNGMTIEGRPGAVVLAPLSGKIQFSGSFKRYGNLIIIEHGKGYHSLVTGLKEISTVVGQTVITGEPIGELPKTLDGSKPKLYYELRYNGHPVNPTKLFADLG